MDKERFRVIKGRERPSFQPKNIRCAGCGAGLTVKNEHTKMVVCNYCGSHMDISEEEEKVLGKAEGDAPLFTIQLGDSYRYRAARYEVLARMAFIEEGDRSEMTREYLMFNPRRGSLWLGEYKGQYSMTEPSHVEPKSDPFSVTHGAVLETHDGKQWVAEGSGTYELVYVDGALPWIASVGDTIQYADFSEKSGTGEQYEVQRTKDEIEYGAGRRLKLESVRLAMRKPDLGKESVYAPVEDVAVRRKWYMQLMLVIFIVVLINGLAALYCTMKGKEVLRQYFGPKELTNGVLSKPFEVRGNGRLTKIMAHAALDNAWMSVDAAIVRDTDGLVVHTYEADMQYYHGREGGENWSEGNQTSDLLIRIPEPGTYRLNVQGVSARGNASRTNRAFDGLEIRIKDGALQVWKFVASGILSLVLFILVACYYNKWRTQDLEDDED